MLEIVRIDFDDICQPKLLKANQCRTDDCVKVKSKVGDLYRGSLRSRSLQSRSTILPLFIGPYACCHITAH